MKKNLQELTTARQSELDKQKQAITKHAQSEQKKLVSATNECIRNVQKTTQDAIKKTHPVKTLALSITMVLLLGIVLGVGATLYIQDKTLVTKYSSDPDLILCEDAWNQDGKILCQIQ